MQQYLNNAPALFKNCRGQPATVAHPQNVVGGFDFRLRCGRGWMRGVARQTISGIIGPLDVVGYRTLGGHIAQRNDVLGGIRTNK